MKKYKILKDFSGYQNGYGEQSFFYINDIVEISDYLADSALKDGYIEPIKEEKIIEIEIKEKPNKKKK